MRLFDSSGNALDSEEFDASGGPLNVLPAYSQPGSEPAIGRIEIQSIGDAGDVLIDNFTWSVNPRDVPGAGIPVDIVYHRPDGDYTDTVIIFEGQSYACTPGSLGCVAQVTALPNSIIQFSAERGGVADSTGPFTATVGEEGESVYAFSGNPQGLTGSVGVAPAENEVLLFYQREDGNYDGWTVHLFPTGSPDWTNFNPGLCTVAGVDPVLGGYFLIRLPPQPCYDANPPALDTFPEEMGFIIHKGDEKDPGPDQFIRINEQGNVVFVVSGVNAVESAPPNGSTVAVNGRAAHWVDTDTLLWRPGADVQTVQLAWSADGTIAAGVAELDGNYEAVTLSAGTNPEPDNQRHLSGLPAWEIPGDVAGNAAELARYQLVAIGRDRFGLVVDATAVQIPGVLDDLYADTASGQRLGVDWTGGSPTIRLWAPTADPDFGVTLNLYSDSAGTLAEQVEMTLDPDTGIWSATGSSDWDRRFYDFTLRVWSYAVDQFVVNRVTDPWSVSLAADSRYSQIVNLEDSDLKPAGWDTLSLPTPSQPEDVVLYELHMRDFSVHDPSVPDSLKGKYGAFALETTAGHDHLQALADAGLTHVHILPAFDIATVQERRADRVELEDPVADLCAANPAAAGLCPTHSGKSIGQLLEEITAENPVSEQQQEIVGWLRNLDGFNWGYDPWHFGVPEGSYATDPDGVARIIEFREMVQGLAGKGLRTVMDVVYNHTNAGGQSDRSVLDRVVPGYYHRYNETTGAIETSTCCANTATEFAMMEKLMADTLETFTRDYKVGGFRFDLMGHQPKAAMVRIKERLEAIDPGMFLYGEGWDFGEVGGDRRFEQATQVNMAGTGIATFTDRMRDAIRGGGPFDTGIAHVRTQGFISGLGYDLNSENRPPTENLIAEALLSADQIRAAMAGSIRTFSFEDSSGETVTGADIDYGGAPVGYVDDPSEVINYSAAHDNETLWDISQHKHPEGTTLADRVRAHNLGIDAIVLAQGVPFIHAGQELLRSKSMDRNSFDSGDWFNKLDLTFGDNNWRKGLPPRQDNQASWPQAEDALLNLSADATPAEIAFARDHFREMLQVRKSTVLYRLPDATEISNRVTYFNTGPGQALGVIAQGIEGCSTADFVPEYGYVVTIINANDEAQSLDFGGEFAGQDFQLHPVLVSSVDPVVQSSTFDSGTGTFFVPARTTAVFTRAEQGSCSPFGEDIYLRGSFNDWADPPPAETQLDYDGGVGYELIIDLAAGDYAFKIAGATWSTNCGGTTAGEIVTIDEPFTMACSSSENLGITIAESGFHSFAVDASNSEAPVLTVSKVPYSVPIFVRGFNGDWGLTNRMRYAGEDEYLAVVELTDLASRQFKIASEDWATVNCGSPGDASAPSTEVGEVYPLACGDGTGNLELVTSEPGQYSFLVNASDPANPTVTVTAPPFGQGVTVFVRGLNSDWGTTNPMSFTGDGKYRARVPLIGLEAGDLSFKVASEDWATVNCGVPVDGTDTTVAPGESFVTGCGDGTGDMTLDTDTLGTYDFWLDAGESTTAPALTVTGP
ncbi:MAG: pullulanase-type alpha-1,6-glucosidase [Gammaproteobacteria bacterium]